MDAAREALKNVPVNAAYQHVNSQIRDDEDRLRNRQVVKNLRQREMKKSAFGTSGNFAG